MKTEVDTSNMLQRRTNTSKLTSDDENIDPRKRYGMLFTLDKEERKNVYTSVVQLGLGVLTETFRCCCV